MNEKQILFPAIVMDNNDPMLLGRIRAVMYNENKDQIIQAVWQDVINDKRTAPGNMDDIPEEYKWTTKDPFMCLPLLPFYFNQQPLMNEAVKIIYANKEFSYQNKYYVQDMFSSPITSSFESNLNSGKYTSRGEMIKAFPDLKKKGTTDYFNSRSKGVYPEPGDVSILGRGSSDLILKQDDVLLRSGKMVPQKSRQLPRGYDRRSFLQLSTFTGKEKEMGRKEVTKLIKHQNQPNFILEWSIHTPSAVNPGTFTGAVHLYQLKKSLPYLRNVNVGADTLVQPTDMTLVTARNFTSVDRESAVKFICDRINELNEGRMTDEQGRTINIPGVFPFTFRPNKITYKWISVEDPIMNPIEFGNISYFNSNIKLSPASTVSGTGTLYSRNSFDIPVELVKERVNERKADHETETVGIMGADVLYLLSHGSIIPSKGTVDLKGTLYGIDRQRLRDDVHDKTSSMVRGEELMELLNLIVQFILTHVHSFPGMPPVKVTTSGLSEQDLLDRIRNASDNILNNRIRLN